MIPRDIRKFFARLIRTKKFTIIFLGALLLVYLQLTENNYDRLTVTEESQATTKKSEFTTQLLHFDPILSNDISCFESDEGNALPDILKEKIAPKSIFFHETSCKGALIPREACTVEQAATTNPDKEVYVIFSGPVNKENLTANTALGTLKELVNVHIGRMPLSKQAKGTPADKFLSTYRNIEKGPYRIYNAAIIARLISLYKHGGISLDLDVMSVKNLKWIPRNFIVREKDNSIGTSAMGFMNSDVGTYYTSVAIQLFVHGFRPYEWHNNGPAVMTEVARTLCRRKNKNQIPDECYGVNILNASEFQYSTNYQNKVYGAGSNELLMKTGYRDLARENCPKIYKLFGDSFI